MNSTTEVIIYSVPMNITKPEKDVSGVQKKPKPFTFKSCTKFIKLLNGHGIKTMFMFVLNIS